MSRLLVVHHSPTAGLRALTEAVLAGAADPELAAQLPAGLEVVARPALEAVADDVLAAEALVLVTSANFGYMSGALKHFFDRSFLALGGALGDDGTAGPTAGPASRLPYGLLVHGRYDTEGAVRSVLALAGALPWRRAAEVVAVLGDVDAAARTAAYDLGGTLAAHAAGL